MGKKKKPEKYSLSKEKQAQNKSAKPGQNDTPRWHLPFILIITFIAYLPALNAGFVNWDDGDYVGDNILVKDISRVGELLVTPVQGNHHPITMLSLAINYILSGENAWSYHLLNLLFHLANCFLVYRLALQLSRNNAILAFVASLLFGIHPMPLSLTPVILTLVYANISDWSFYFAYCRCFLSPQLSYFLLPCFALTCCGAVNFLSGCLQKKFPFLSRRLLWASLL